MCRAYGESTATLWISWIQLPRDMTMVCNAPSSLIHMLLCAAIFSFIITKVDAHVAAWHPAMYCQKGNVHGVDDQQTNAAVTPLYQLLKSDWWFHHVNDCDNFPPEPGVFLELPAGGSFTVELAVNRYFTTTAKNPQLGTFGDGQEHPGLGTEIPSQCITSPNIHTENQSMAAGTAFAISYQSDITKVTMENLAIFSVRYQTPWERVATYDVPPDMPACPSGGCICVWVWIPNGCGEPNMYMEGLRCDVTQVNNQTSRPLGPAKPAVYCKHDRTECVSGPKQIVVVNQREGNNIDVTGQDDWPGYNENLGFENGAQMDIFQS